MNRIEHLEVEQAREPTRGRGGGRGPWTILAAAVVLAALIAAYFLLRDRTATPPPGPPAAEETGAGKAPPPPDAGEAQIELPALATSDGPVREWVSQLSSRPELARWLATDALIQRFTVMVTNIAEGVSPRTHLPLLAPEEDFRVTEDGGELVIDPSSYRRYDTVAGVFASLDVQGTARLYRRLKPLIQEAYRHLGYPRGDFDRTLAAAISSLLAVPRLEGPVEVVPAVAGYRYADPRLEELSAAQKHLLRMGPENVEKIQGKLRQIAAALELGPAGAGP